MLYKFRQITFSINHTESYHPEFYLSNQMSGIDGYEEYGLTSKFNRVYLPYILMIWKLNGRSYHGKWVKMV